ncbi:MAG: N-acetyltransferase family protein [Nanoarchaeota archaeon]
MQSQMDIQIRQASPEDLEHIQNLNRLLFEQEYQDYDHTLKVQWPASAEAAGYYREAIEDEETHAVFLAWDGPVPVGYLLGGLVAEETWRDVSLMAELANMFIAPQYRGRGIGTHLMDAFIEWSEEHGVSRIKVIASAQNHRAIDFYRGAGFRDYTISLERTV